MKQAFENQVGIITGAASGIGFAIAKKLSSYNVKLALFDKSPTLLQLQPEFPTGTKFFIVDITDEEQTKKKSQALPNILDQ